MSTASTEATEPAPIRTKGFAVEFEHDGVPVWFFVLDGRDTVQRDLWQGRFYEKEELEIIARHFPKHGVYLDVGANIGNHCIYVGKFLQPTRIIPVEPFGKAATVLTLNLRLNDLMGVCDPNFIGIGFGADRHFAEATIVPGNLGGTQLNKSNDAGGIPIVSGDQALGLARIDFIKIDVEKMELQVLAGLAGVIKENRPTMFIEVDHQNRAGFLEWCSANKYKDLERFSRYGSNENFLIVPE